MSVSDHHFCKKCRTCNTLASPQAGNTDATSHPEAVIGACFGSGDASTKDDADETITHQFSRTVLTAPLPSHNRVSGTSNTIVSDSSSPRSDDSSNVSDAQKKLPFPNDSLLQYLQHDQESKCQTVVSQIPLLNRSVVGQEKSPSPGTLSVASASVSSGTSTSNTGISEIAPKERRRWIRPPLIGQAASNTEVKIMDEFQPSGEEDSLVDDSSNKISHTDDIDNSVASEIFVSKHEKLKSSSSNESANNSSLSKSIETGDSTDENLPQASFQTSMDGEQGMLSDSYAGGKASPSSSVASHKRLEWDSGADVGYQDYQNVSDTRTSILKLSAIERLALIQNTDKALRMRLDPEGISSSVPSTGNNPTPTFNTYPLTYQHGIGQPSAESTPIERASSLKSQRKINTGAVGISPITVGNCSKQALSSNISPAQEFREAVEIDPASPKHQTQSVFRPRSASLLNLPTAVTDPSNYLYLYRSHSDPDISADAGAHTDDSFSLRDGQLFTPRKASKEKSLDTHSLSSGSEKTLIQVPAGGSSNEARNAVPDQSSTPETEDQTGYAQGLADILNTYKLPENLPPTSKGYSCSDTDHRHGLHHHYGILCSSSLIIPSEFSSLHLRPAETQKPAERQHSSVNSLRTSSSYSSHSGVNSQDLRRNDAKLVQGKDTQDRATSVSPAIDEMIEGTSAYVGKATSFEYLPGRIYESEIAALKSSIPTHRERDMSLPLSSDSTSIDSDRNSIKQQIVRLNKRKAVATSSGDSEDALWSSPRISTGTLVRDLERGVSLLRGLVHNNANNTAAQRELVRRVVHRLVSSEYTDDLLERQIRRQSRRPLSGGHTFGTRQPTSQSHSETEQRTRSAPHRSSRRVQSSISKTLNKASETCTQPSDTVSSSATESSSLQSTSGNESQNVKTKESTPSFGTVQRVSDNQNQPSEPVDQPAQSSEQASNHSSHSNRSKHTESLPEVPSVVNVGTVTTNPFTTDAATSPVNLEIRPAVSYGTLSSVVSITPLTITVQSSPANVPTKEAGTSEVSSNIKATTSNAATMTTAPESVAEPVPSTSSAPVTVVSDAQKEIQNSKDDRRKKKNGCFNHKGHQLQLINCEISHLKTIQQLLKRHPNIEISAPMDHRQVHHTQRKPKVSNRPTSDDHRPRPHQNERPMIIVQKPSVPATSADSRSSINSTSTFSSTSLSTSASERFTGGDPAEVLTQEEEKRSKTSESQKSRKQRDESSESEDSVTRAVTKAVSSRVKALRNLGQIEEAEVKIRVRMGQPEDGALLEKITPTQFIDPSPKMSISHRKPPQTTVEQSDDFDSKKAELDELIARQRAMDAEARKKLQLLNEMRENVLRQTNKTGRRDACTLTSVDTATNTTPINPAKVSRGSQIKESSVESSSPVDTSRTCPACRARTSKRVPEDIPMCRHDPGFTAGRPRGRQRPPLAYFLKVEEEEQVVKSPPVRMPSLEVVTVKVRRPVRPPSSVGSSRSMSSASSSSSRQSPAHSPQRGANVNRVMASSVPAFGRHSGQSSPTEVRRRRSPRKPAKREVATSKSVPHLGRGDANHLVSDYSSDDQAPGTLQACLTNNFPEYIEAAERRRQCIHEMSYLRRLRQESRKRLVQLDGDAWVYRQKQAKSQRASTAPAKPAQKPKPSSKSMRLSSARKYAQMPEVQQKKLEMKKKEDNRTNRLLKEIYTTKLRERALRGETTLRSSVSVISSL